MRKVYIDADSVIYRSLPVKTQEAPEEPEGWIVARERMAIQDRTKQLLRTGEFVIEASSEQKAKEVYSEQFGVHISELIIVGYNEAESIDLPTATDEGFEDSKRYFMSNINDIMTAVIARYSDLDPDPVIVITVKGHTGLEANYRYAIMEGVQDEAVKPYKGNRADKEVPHGLIELYDWVFDQPNTICEAGIEADDYVVRKGLEGGLVCALDKDVIGSLPEAYNYGKKEWTTRTALEIKQFPYLQTIMGDSSDGLRGVFKVGVKGAEKALKGKETDLEMWTAVVTEYFKKGQSLEEAIATMHCVRMDMWTEEEGLVLWTPPKKEKTDD